MKITSREIIIAAVAILVLLGIGYVINNNNNNNKTEDTKTEDNVNLDEENSDDEEEENTESSNIDDENIESVNPAADAKVNENPDEISIKFKKAIKGGSEIKVVSDKGVDVVPSANRLSTDRMTLSVPVEISAAGKYDVSYSYCLDDGTCKDGSYSFTVE